jgi:hypothetical protein
MNDIIAAGIVSVALLAVIGMLALAVRLQRRERCRRQEEETPRRIIKRRYDDKEMNVPISREAFLENQEKLCADRGYPFFMPGDGICFRCRRDIVTHLIERGQDGKSLVTGCPLCLYSYCD